MKKLLVCVALATGAFLPQLAMAQFGMPSLPGMGKSSGSSAPAADLGGQQDALVRNFVGASKLVLTAQSKMADALGLKNQATAAEQTAAALGDGATKDNLSDSNKVVADTSGAIKESLAKKPVLDAAAKTRYAEGLGNLVAGAVKYAGLGKDVKGMGDSMKSASPMALTKLGSAAFVVSKFPGSASDLFSTLQTAVAFARDQGIALPPDTQSAMDALNAPL
jgi:hypothetical protein